MESIAGITVNHARAACKQILTTGLAQARGFEPTTREILPPGSSLEVVAVASPPAGVSNGALIRWGFEILNTRDVEPLRALWTDATVQRFPSATVRGPDAIAGYFQALFDALADFHMQIVALAESGDDVFVRWHLTGTHTGARVEGIDPTGRAVAIDGMDHLVVRDRTIVTNFVVSDQMQFARQIGMLPPDGSAGDRATKAAFNARTRLRARLRRRRRR
jgi:predicted ester cyclase